MLDWFRRKVLSPFLKKCPVCGSGRVSVEKTKLPSYVVDGPCHFDCRCRACGHTWQIPGRPGI